MDMAKIELGYDINMMRHYSQGLMILHLSLVFFKPLPSGNLQEKSSQVMTSKVSPAVVNKIPNWICQIN